MKQFIQKINQEYSISATTMKPYHSVWKITTTAGQTYILKKIKTAPEYFAILAQLVQELYLQGFEQLVPILPTRHGEFYIQSDNGFFSLSKCYAGEKPSFMNPQHLKKIGQCFGRIHEFSRRIQFPKTLMNEYGIDEYQSYHLFLENLLPGLPERNKLNRVDRAVIEWSSYFLNQSRNVIQELNHYTNLTTILYQQRGFCHNDPAPGNIIMDHQHCYLIDFEFISCDVWLKELAHLVMRVLQATGWNPKEPLLDILITAYNQERPLLDIELQILPILLRFPRRFWRFCHQRYQENLIWPEKRYHSRIWEIITEESQRSLFLENWSQVFHFC
ncbi:MAG TPA: hypothetical protein DDW50_00350 [Firmicutes bacterium]|nr:hypothetical protein [Bacillota bacterium]